MKYTENLSLKLPEASDNYNIEDMNHNSLILDEKLESTNQAISGLNAVDKYNNLGVPEVVYENGMYVNKWTTSLISQNPVEGTLFYITTPIADTAQMGNKFHNVGYNIEVDNFSSTALNLTNGLDKAFDNNDETYFLSGQDSNTRIVVEFPEKINLTSIGTFIPGDNIASITIEGSNDKNEWSTLNVLTEADSEYKQHSFLVSGEYKYYSILIKTTSGSCVVKTIKFEEDINFPTNWILGNHDGIINFNSSFNINNIEVESLKPQTQYILQYRDGKFKTDATGDFYYTFTGEESTLPSSERYGVNYQSFEVIPRDATYTKEILTIGATNYNVNKYDLGHNVVRVRSNSSATTNAVIHDVITGFANSSRFDELNMIFMFEKPIAINYVYSGTVASSPYSNDSYTYYWTFLADNKSFEEAFDKSTSVIGNGTYSVGGHWQSASRPSLFKIATGRAYTRYSINCPKQTSNINLFGYSLNSEKIENHNAYLGLKEVSLRSNNIYSHSVDKYPSQMTLNVSGLSTSATTKTFTLPNGVTGSVSSTAAMTNLGSTENTFNGTLTFTFDEPVFFLNATSDYHERDVNCSTFISPKIYDETGTNVLATSYYAVYGADTDSSKYFYYRYRLGSNGIWTKKISYSLNGYTAKVAMTFLIDTIGSLARVQTKNWFIDEKEVPSVTTEYKKYDIKETYCTEHNIIVDISDTIGLTRINFGEPLEPGIYVSTSDIVMEITNADDTAKTAVAARDIIICSKSLSGNYYVASLYNNTGASSATPFTALSATALTADYHIKLEKIH